MGIAPWMTGAIQSREMRPCETPGAAQCRLARRARLAPPGAAGVCMQDNAGLRRRGFIAAGVRTTMASLDNRKGFP
ncbi:hypothetical protein D3C71_1918670 [compost metagenome]